MKLSDQIHPQNWLKTWLKGEILYCNSVVFSPKHIPDILLGPQETIPSFENKTDCSF